VALRRFKRTNRRARFADRPARTRVSTKSPPLKRKRKKAAAVSANFKRVRQHAAPRNCSDPRHRTLLWRAVQMPSKPAPSGFFVSFVLCGEMP